MFSSDFVVDDTFEETTVVKSILKGNFWPSRNMMPSKMLTTPLKLLARLDLLN